MQIFDGQNINPNSNPIVANNAQLYTLEFDDDDGFFGLDDQDDTVTIIDVTDPANPIAVFTDVSFSFEGAGVFPPNAQPQELAGREVAVIDVLDGNGNVIDSFFFFIDGGQTAPIANGNSRLRRSDLDVTPTPICFADDTLISTPEGQRTVQTIRAGDHVMTSRGVRRVIYASSAKIDSVTQILSPNVRKVLIKKGAFGIGRPYKDLRVSQQHRLKFSGAEIEALFGQQTVFAPARAFVDHHNVVIEKPGVPFCYHHFALAEHAAITVHGIETETLYLGDVAKGVLSGAEQTAITSAFLNDPEVEGPHIAAGTLLSMFEAKVLSDHLKRRGLQATVDYGVF